jgi:hypothetical protein
MRPPLAPLTPPYRQVVPTRVLSPGPALLAGIAGIVMAAAVIGIGSHMSSGPSGTQPAVRAASPSGSPPPSASPAVR